MTTQTAIAITAIKAPMTKITLPIPEPQENEVLIKLTATAIAPFDQKLRDFGLYNLAARLPAVVTHDVVGTVVKNGPNSSQFPIGSRVFGQTTMKAANGGGLQEFTIVDARYAAVVPKGLSDMDAVLFPVNAFTSVVALFDPSGLGMPWPFSAEGKTFDYASQKLVIIGGGAHCGKMAIQLAKVAGVGTIIVTASLSSAEELKEYGATHVINRKAKDAGEQIRALVGDDLVYAYDTCTSDHSLGVSLLSNSKKGTLAHLTPGTIDEEVKARKVAGFEDKQVFGGTQAHPELAVSFWEKLPGWIESGDIKINKYKVIEGLDLEKINAAVDAFRDGKGERVHVRLG